MKQLATEATKVAEESKVNLLQIVTKQSIISKYLSKHSYLKEDVLLKAIIVDDEAPARSELRFLLSELNQTEVVAEAANVREAIEKLKEYPCDVMFLDINMPEATGLQLAEAMQHLKFPPAVVFVTAYSEFALDAFKVNAVDYLVKPVETERLAQALARVREHVKLHAQAQKAERIPVEKGGKKILINIDEIRFVMARDDYAYLQTDSDRYFSTVSLAQLEKTLDGHGFFRVHRGYLVNLSLVKEVEPQSGGTLLLTLDGVEDRIPVSRRRVSSLKKALGLQCYQVLPIGLLAIDHQANKHKI